MARGDAKLQHLQSVRLFAACTKKELQTLGKVTDELEFADGKALCEEGTPGHEFFLILEGTAKVKRKGRSVAALTEGSYFGELALLDGGLRNATVTADGPLKVLVLGQREFAGVLEEVPTLARKLLQTMAGRLREADARTLS